MCIICDNKIDQSTKRLQELKCYSCRLLTNIPSIQGLKKLYCSYCPLLTNIPSIQGLQVLDCFNCPLLTNISSIQVLQNLCCSYCPLLTCGSEGACPKKAHIPSIQGLKILDCSNCPLLTDIPSIQGLQNLCCCYCPWLNIDNMEYEINIKKLKILQQWIKKVILSKRLRELIPLLMPLYYNPEAKGGYMHKKKMLNFIINI